MNFPKKLTFRVHAIRRMFERSISEDDIRNTSASGNVIQEYPDDKPYPICLVCGQANGKYLVAREKVSAPRKKFARKSTKFI
ncbi:MAG: DUF4258 domain-containing protein, partial [Chlamydiia bacterium]|nr:DUF4258 domain-containing protein [Chlamydiia bacterium]